MADLNKLITPLFLNEKEIRKIIELMFFSYRDFTSGPDKILEKINFGIDTDFFYPSQQKHEKINSAFSSAITRHS